MSEIDKSTWHETRGIEPGRKDPYNAPKLINYGLVRNLTKGGTGTQNENKGAADNTLKNRV